MLAAVISIVCQATIGGAWVIKKRMPEIVVRAVAIVVMLSRRIMEPSETAGIPSGTDIRCSETTNFIDNEVVSYFYEVWRDFVSDESGWG